jgi:transcriptional regulator with XRE-family HTH domain
MDRRTSPPYVRFMTIQPGHVGEHLKDWRLCQRISQVDLACEAQISTRHRSFLEMGRVRPSREMILNLAEQLQISASGRADGRHGGPPRCTKENEPCRLLMS